MGRFRSYYLKDRVAQVEASPQWKSFLEDGILPANDPNFNPRYISKGQLKVEGWTEKAIELFLGEHDSTRTNPMFASAAPMKLYMQHRVEQAQNTEEFKAFIEKTRKGRSLLVREYSPRKRLC